MLLDAEDCTCVRSRHLIVFRVHLAPLGRLRQRHYCISTQKLVSAKGVMLLQTQNISSGDLASSSADCESSKCRPTLGATSRKQLVCKDLCLENQAFKLNMCGRGHCNNTDTAGPKPLVTCDLAMHQEVYLYVSDAQVMTSTSLTHTVWALAEYRMISILTYT